MERPPIEEAIALVSPSSLPNFGGLVNWDNQFFTGGVGIALLGFAAQFAKRGSSLAQSMVRRHCVVTLEVTSKDSSYPWVLNWLNSHGRTTQHLSVNTALKKQRDGSTSLSFEMTPGPGKHWIWYEGRYFMVERTRETGAVNMHNGTPWEKVVLTSLGRNVRVFSSLLVEAQRNAMKREEGFTTIYTCWGTEWRAFGLPRKKRALSSVVLHEGVSERIVKDLREWKDSAAWYHERGIPYRRGYLLYGPPGGGKTSFIFALAGELDYNIAILNLNDEGMTDDRLAQAMSVVPPKTFVLLEDIDAAFVQRDQTLAGKNHLTFSGLLNTLDGVASSEERLVFMTTNYMDRLDSALIRPGRVDLVECIGDADWEQVKRLFQNFFLLDADDHPLARDFADKIVALAWKPSMADLQGYLLTYKDQPGAALESVDRVLREPRITARAGLLVPSSNSDPSQKRPRKVKHLSAFDVDRMVFNPQPGWDDKL